MFEEELKKCVGMKFSFWVSNLLWLLVGCSTDRSGTYRSDDHVGTQIFLDEIGDSPVGGEGGKLSDVEGGSHESDNDHGGIFGEGGELDSLGEAGIEAGGYERHALGGVQYDVEHVGGFGGVHLSGGWAGSVFHAGSEHVGGMGGSPSEMSGGSEREIGEDDAFDLSGLVINEVDYDQEGRSDEREFVEIFNGSENRVPLEHLGLEYINGDTGRRIGGGSIPFSSAVRLDVDGGEIPVRFLDPLEYLVVAKEALAQDLPLHVPRIVVRRSLQNSSEGIRLVEHLHLEQVQRWIGEEDFQVSDRGRVIHDTEDLRIIQYSTGTEENPEYEYVCVMDSLSYGGQYPEDEESLSIEGELLESEDSNDVQGSINRCPNGVDTDNNRVDFIFLEILSPGVSNPCVDRNVGEEEG